MGSSKKRSLQPDSVVSCLEKALEPYLHGSNAVTQIAVAYSGGVDSTALLHATRELSSRQGKFSVIALHIHHGLSPHADQWLKQCESICESLGVALLFQRIKIQPRGGDSIEALARDLRYQALSDLCHHENTKLLLTGHHRNDDVETVLVNLIRGGGIASLCGIPRQRHWQGITVLRPLIELPRTALLEFAQRHSLPFVEDESNDNQRFLRNAIRHRIMPLLTDISTTASEQIVRTARHAREAQALLDEMGQTDLAVLFADQKGFDLAPLRQLSYPRAKNALRTWFRTHHQYAPTSGALEEMLLQLRGAKDSSRLIAGPRNCALRVYRGRVSVSIDDGTRSTAAEIFITWRGEPEIEVAQWQGRLRFQPAHLSGLASDWLRTTTLTLRPRCGGERLRMQENGPSRTLKNLYQERAIPPWQRTALPLLFADQELIMACGIGTDARVLAQHAHLDGPYIELGWERIN